MITGETEATRQTRGQLGGRARRQQNKLRLLGNLSPCEARVGCQELLLLFFFFKYKLDTGSRVRVEVKTRMEFHGTKL